MKIKIFLLFIIYSITTYSQCFDCGHSIGGHTEDYVVDIDKATDGIILTTNPNQGWGRSIYKYDFNCNLVWTNRLEPDNSISSDGISFSDTTLDSNNNIYSIITNHRGGEIIEGFTIEQGNSLIKLNSTGSIVWVKKISDQYYLKRKVHFWNDNIYVVGQLDEEINTNIGLTVSSDMGESQYFIAQFDILGNLIKSQLYGTNSYDYFFDSQIDDDGNIYFTGQMQSSSVSYYYTTGIPYFFKINSNLNLIWSKNISNYLNLKFTPLTIYYNNTNNNLYLWNKYYKSTPDSNGCNVGSVVMEISKNTGNIENQITIDNCGYMQPVGNGTANVEQKSFITHEGSNLYILSSFRKEITIGNQTVNSTKTIHDQYNSDLILYKIDLTNFSPELILKSNGEQYYSSSPYYDLAGPIVAFNESVYITSSFTSSPITINGNTIINNSGNNGRDILYYKYNLNQDSPNNLISFKNTCLSETTEFSINGDFDSVLWNFDNPDSGLDNTSTLTNPKHTFTNSGIYNVSVLVTCGIESETLNIEVVVTDSPNVNQISDIYACEDVYGSQISSSFDSSSIENDLIGNQSNLTIKYFNENGIELPSPLPNPFSNSILGQETITVRVAQKNNPTCFTETSFDLIVESLPKINQVSDIYECDDDNDGFTEFNISNIKEVISENQNGVIIELFYENGQQLPNPLPNTILNKIPNKETITARVTNTQTNCYNEIYFDLIVKPLPIANPLNIIYGCDDNNDGISEYFDTSIIKSQVLNGQTGMTISYFDYNGNQLPSPLPNPFTNSNPFNESITVRVSNANNSCYAETILQLQTTTQPNINKPDNLYACDQGNGYAEFDTSNIEQQIIGNQTGLTIQYYNSNNKQLPSPLPLLFQNTKPFYETIIVKVEDSLNPTCYLETSFNLIVNNLPEIDLEKEYIICNLDPSISLNINPNFYSYNWFFEDGSIISNTNNAKITKKGNYLLTVTQIKNGVTCENSFDFKLIRSVLPKIQEVNHGGLGNNFIKVIASGDGNLEYSIDGVNYQENNYFLNNQGGTYKVFVRDKQGCGQDFKEITIIDYPKFFTPNNDGYNDFWHIKGISKFPHSTVSIFNRFGKLLTKLSSDDLGWNGLSNGIKMPSNDYWFKVSLGNGQVFTGHFSLKR